MQYPSPFSDEDGEWIKDSSGWAIDLHVTRKAARKLLITLISAFPTERIPQRNIYADLLLDHVMAEQCEPVSLHAAVHQLIATKTFVPAIAEVLAEIKKQEEFWDKLFDAVNDFEAAYKDLEEHCGKLAKREGERQLKKPAGGIKGPS